MAVENQARNPFGAIRIVECGAGVSAAFGAKLLADLGADVIKIESPTGDLTRHRGPFRTANPTRKRARFDGYLTHSGISLAKLSRQAFCASLTDRASHT
jgi:crotonobetainyl-CoA:carnitine CoA-transferase CaiB-like acyl-CoA transferase